MTEHLRPDLLRSAPPAVGKPSSSSGAGHATSQARMAEARVLPVIAPTLERHQHDPVTLVDHAIADESGAIAHPYRTWDILACLEADGRITREQYDAGMEFRTEFAAAMLDQLQAADYAKPVVSGMHYATNQSYRVQAARRRVNDTLNLLGTMRSPAGSCVYHVIGLEWSLRRWRLEMRKVRSQHMAQKVLIGALIVMALPQQARTRYA